MEFSARQIADFLHGTIEGNENATVSTFSKIEEGTKGSISFLANPAYEHYIYETKSSIVLVNDSFKPSKPIAATLIRVSNAYEAMAGLLALYEQSKPRKSGIHPLACIDPTAKIGEGCYVEAFAVVSANAVVGDGTQLYAHATIGENSKVGSNCTIYPNVSIYHDCVVGNNVIIHSGAVIGADGFGFAPAGDSYDKIPQIGIVTIEDNVEIGANTCIDRSTMGSTIIHKNVKLDNLIQIAHNVEIGEASAFAAQTGIAGSAKIGKHCIIGGQGAVAGHITVGDGVMVGAQSGVSHSLKGGQIVLGSPAIPFGEEKRLIIYRKKLPELYKRVDELEKKLSKNE